MWAYLLLTKTIIQAKNLLFLISSTLLFNLYIDLPVLEDIPWIKWLTTPAFITLLYVIFNFWNSNRKVRLDEYSFTTTAMKELIIALNQRNDNLEKTLRGLRQENLEVYKEISLLREEKSNLETKLNELSSLNNKLIDKIDLLTDLIENAKLDKKTK